MMNNEELLEWYIMAGVDVICGDTPMHSGTKPTQLLPTIASLSTDTRPAITDLAQMSSSACQNAREICARAQTLAELRQATEQFEGCSLKLTANKTVFGSGNEQAKIMLVGEAPGSDEDRTGEAFVGKCGQLLNKMLASIGLSREDCYITNVIMWRPPGNRTPTGAEVAVCLPFLKRKIELIRPKLILALGASAAGALLDNNASIGSIRGKWFDYTLSVGQTIPLLPTYHPSFLLRNSSAKAKSWSDLLRFSKKITNN